jgi:hypothetical protein
MQALFHDLLAIINQNLPIFYLLNESLLILYHISFELAHYRFEITLAAILEEQGVHLPNRFHDTSIVACDLFQKVIETHTIHEQHLVKSGNLT